MELTSGVPDIDRDAESLPTTDDRIDLPRMRRARRVRQLGVAVLTGILALGILGLLGVREGSTSAVGGGYELEVDYPRITRPGLAVPLSITVRKAGGFDGPVTITITQEYLSLFDLNGLFPDPDKATADGDDLEWEFEPPAGDPLKVLVDTRTGPTTQPGKRGVVAVVDDGTPVVSVRFRTTVLP